MKNLDEQFPSFKCLRVFEEIARFCNVARAAEELNITPSAASHQLAKLEKKLGCALFNRSAKGMFLTIAGDRYLKEAGPLVQGILQATDRVSNEKERSALRIHCAPSFGLLWLLPRIHAFREKYPELEVALSCTYENLSFSRSNTDIAIRHGFPDWPSLEIKTLRNEKMSVLASPDYLRQNPVDDVNQISQHSLILSESPLLKWPQWFAQHHLSQPEKDWLFRFDRSYMSLEAGMLGYGLVFESELLAQDYLHSGRLVRVLPPEWSMPVSAHHLIYPRGFSQFRRVSQFMEWMMSKVT